MPAGNRLHFCLQFNSNISIFNPGDPSGSLIQYFTAVAFALSLRKYVKSMEILTHTYTYIYLYLCEICALCHFLHSCTAGQRAISIICIKLEIENTKTHTHRKN